MQHASDLGYIIVREDLGSVRIQESRGSEELELFVAIELQDDADAVQDFAADAAVARFEPAERAVMMSAWSATCFWLSPRSSRRRTSTRPSSSPGPDARAPSALDILPRRSALQSTRAEQMSRAHERGSQSSFL